MSEDVPNEVESPNEFNGNKEDVEPLESSDRNNDNGTENENDSTVPSQSQLERRVVTFWSPQTTKTVPHLKGFRIKLPLTQSTYDLVFNMSSDAELSQFATRYIQYLLETSCCGVFPRSSLGPVIYQFEESVWPREVWEGIQYILNERNVMYHYKKNNTLVPIVHLHDRQRYKQWTLFVLGQLAPNWRLVHWSPESGALRETQHRNERLSSENRDLATWLESQLERNESR